MSVINSTNGLLSLLKGSATPIVKFCFSNNIKGLFLKHLRNFDGSWNIFSYCVPLA